MSRRGMALAVGIAASGGTLSACRAPGPVLMDLASERENASFYAESGRIDLGTPDARRHLFVGWARDEKAADGSSFVWGVGPSSSVRFRILGRRALGLQLRGWPFAPPGSTPQTVEVIVNGRTLERWTLQAAAATYRAAIPKDAVRLGENELELRYGRHASPAELVRGALDTRPLAAAWDLLEISGADGPVQAKVAPTGRFLVMPLGTGVSYALGPRFGATLELAAIELPSLSEGRPFLRASLLGSAGVTTHDFEASGRNLSWPIPTTSEGEVLLRLEAMWDGASPRDGAAVRLLAPVLRAPLATDPTARQAGRVPAGGKNRPPNVLLYVIDTLRADRLGCYGHPGGLTPRIDAFARGGVVFERAFAASSWTRTSMATVLTGLAPRRHAVLGRDDALPRTVRTLPERLRESGYETVAFVTNGNLAPRLGFDQGFDRYEYLADAPLAEGHVRSDALNVRVMEWLDGRADPRPFFLYVHSMDPHDPYVDPQEGPGGRGAARPGSTEFMLALEEGRIPASSELRERLLALYEAEIRFNDARFGELLERLEARSPSNATLVVLLSDHGEEFADHGWWRHGKTLYAEQLHVPLIVRLPAGRWAGRRVNAAARHVDIVPTLLDATGLLPDPTLPGARLLARAEREDEAAEERPVYARLDLDGRWVESVEQQGHKLIRYLAYDRPRPPEELFAVRDDFGETHPLAVDGSGVGPLLRGLLEHPKVAGTPGVREAAEIDAELEERLRAVGYVH